MNLKKINFKQPKYIFPLIIAIPAGCLLYLMADLFGDLGDEEEAPSDFINTELPQPNLSRQKTKEEMMRERYEIDEAFGAVEAIGKESQSKEMLEDGSDYTDDEIDQIMNETEEQRIQREQIEEAQRKIEDAQRAYRKRQSNSERVTDEQRREYEYDSYKAVEERQKQRMEQMRNILKGPDPEEQQRAEMERLAREERERKAKEEAPSLVVKADNLAHSKFNTVASNDNSTMDAPLIKAMIDQTTKSSDGTRLRFKLLDDVIINDVKIRKGSYLYGIVSGFGQQRVKATISSILVGEEFLKVSLNVYDLDGMEGFYVPESSFREFIQNAASTVAGQNIQFSNNMNSGTGFNAENVALQAIQNVYQAMSGAVSKNLRKNKAKIKYNTIVYLINSKN